MNGATLAASDGGMVQVTLPPPLDQRAARWLLLGFGFATGMEFYTFDRSIWCCRTSPAAWVSRMMRRAGC
jgi:hypothetical protein